MNRILSSFLAIIMLTTLSNAQKLTILHTNDMHSRLMGFAPSSEYSPMSINDDKTRGGFARLAYLINERVKENPEETLVVDAGDFLMGTLFHTMETTEGFQLRLMKRMGYDVVALGNHEFDFGVDKLANIIAASKVKGEIPPVILSNIEFNPEESKDDFLEDLYDRDIVSRYKLIEKNGIRIGFLALMGVDAADVAPFVEPARFTDYIETARDISQYLKNDKNADLVICLSHSGVTKDKKGLWAGEDVELAKEVPFIDVIISGHTHTHIFEPIIINGTPIVQSGSEAQFLGQLEIEKKDDGWEVINGGLTLIDDRIPGDPVIQGLIDEYQEKISRTVFGEMGIVAGEPVVETGFDLLFSENTRLEDSNLAPMVADAIHWYVNTITPNDVTLVAAGLVRDEVKVGESGMQLANDLFRVVPLGSGVYDDSPGYSLSRIYVTGRELKSVLEVMLIAPKLSTSNYPFWEGIKFKYNPRRMLFDQVYEVELGNDKDGYEKISLAKRNEQLYSVTTNNYVLEFFGLIGDITKGILKVVPKDKDGNPITDLDTAVIDGDPDKAGIQEVKEWQALIQYVSQFPDTNGNGIPDVPDYYREPESEKGRNPSINPILLYKNTNGINAVVSLVVVGILTGTGFLIF